MDTISALTGGNNNSNSPSAISQLSSDEFLDIVLQEIQNQDPLEPNDTSQMLEQLSTIKSIQSDSDMIDSLGELVGQNELASASGLIGKLVSGLNNENNRVAGIVESVTQGSDGVSLQLDDGTRVPMSRLDAILAPEEREDNPDEQPEEDPEEIAS